MNEKLVVEIIEFTDPVCTWCWGSEPVLRRLETIYGDKINIKFIMGGLVKDIREFYDSFNDIGGDAEHSNNQIAKHWQEASETHGMPVKSEGFTLFSNEHPSSYPQNIAYKAAQIENEELANKFLRKMREATAAQAKQTNKTEVLIELASEAGLDVPRFIERFSNGSAEKAFEQDLDTTRRYGVTGFPTFLIRFGKKEVLLRGYQRFETIQSVIESISGGSVKEHPLEKTDENILQFIKKYVSAAPVEIQMVFDLSDPEVNEVTERLITEWLIKKVPAGKGYLVETTDPHMSSNGEMRTCSV
jgi:putative protein-disulfide isomerase